MGWFGIKSTSEVVCRTLRGNLARHEFFVSLKLAAAGVAPQLRHFAARSNRELPTGSLKHPLNLIGVFLRTSFFLHFLSFPSNNYMKDVSAKSESTRKDHCKHGFPNVIR